MTYEVITELAVECPSFYTFALVAVAPRQTANYGGHCSTPGKERHVSRRRPLLCALPA